MNPSPPHELQSLHIEIMINPYVAAIIPCARMALSISAVAR